MCRAAVSADAPDRLPALDTDAPYVVQSMDQVVAVLAAARSYSAGQRRRGDLTHLTSLIDRLAEGPLTLQGAGVSWRVKTPAGFADWVELIYEAGAPLGLSARLFDRPRITIDALPSRLASRDCTASPQQADPALRSAALVDLGAALEVRDVREPEVLARIYRTFKIWAQP